MAIFFLTSASFEESQESVDQVRSKSISLRPKKCLVLSLKRNLDSSINIRKRYSVKTFQDFSGNSQRKQKH